MFLHYILQRPKGLYLILVFLSVPTLINAAQSPPDIKTNNNQLNNKQTPDKIHRTMSNKFITLFDNANKELRDSIDELNKKKEHELSELMASDKTNKNELQKQIIEKYNNLGKKLWDKRNQLRRKIQKLRLAVQKEYIHGSSDLNSLQSTVTSLNLDGVRNLDISRVLANVSLISSGQLNLPAGVTSPNDSFTQPPVSQTGETPAAGNANIVQGSLPQESSIGEQVLEAENQQQAWLRREQFFEAEKQRIQQAQREAEQRQHRLNGLRNQNNQYDGPLDCNDTVAAIRPTAQDICNGIDDNCDGRIDWDTAANRSHWVPMFLDRDGDGHGDPSERADMCPRDALLGDTDYKVSRGDDCDDTNAEIWQNCQ
ncbi:MAG: hypothetical protein GY781_01215 [Gammaproteobacteria bacterium]|nr:hypothetical protein [Gammaproteobacteria bacterium]